MTSIRLVRPVLLAALLSLALLGPVTVLAAAADPLRLAPVAAAPTLNPGATSARAPWLFTVTGQGFTPGGRVYLAVYDQMGAKLYETRWIEASPDATVLRHEPGDGPLGRSPETVAGGALRATFVNLCGATVMERALDAATNTWSNWVDAVPTCGGHDH
jgi:hypothetical protein